MVQVRLNQTVREAAISHMVHAVAQIMTWFPIMAELQGDWKKLCSRYGKVINRTRCEIWSYCKQLRCK